MSRTVPILAYHKVDRESPTRFWVSTKSFDLQMEALRKLGFESVSLNDLWLCSRGSRDLPGKPVCITFDDGYENFFTRAFPILKRHGFTATVFLPTAFIGDSSRHWNEWDRSPEERSFRASHLVWPEVMELQRCGIEFGAHTRTHQDLAALFRSAPQEAESEIAESKHEIEKRLSTETGFLSYPYKAASLEIEDMARRSGFLGAVTVNDRAFDISGGNWFSMDRIPVFSGRHQQTPEDIRSDFLNLFGLSGQQTKDSFSGD